MCQRTPGPAPGWFQPLQVALRSSAEHFTMVILGAFKHM